MRTAGIAIEKMRFHVPLQRSVPLGSVLLQAIRECFSFAVANQLSESLEVFFTLVPSLLMRFLDAFSRIARDHVPPFCIFLSGLRLFFPPYDPFNRTRVHRARPTSIPDAIRSAVAALRSCQIRPYSVGWRDRERGRLN